MAFSLIDLNGEVHFWTMPANCENWAHRPVIVETCEIVKENASKTYKFFYCSKCGKGYFLFTAGLKTCCKQKLKCGRMSSKRAAYLNYVLEHYDCTQWQHAILGGRDRLEVKIGEKLALGVYDGLDSVFHYERDNQEKIRRLLLKALSVLQ